MFVSHVTRRTRTRHLHATLSFVVFYVDVRAVAFALLAVSTRVTGARTAFVGASAITIRTVGHLYQTLNFHHTHIYMY